MPANKYIARLTGEERALCEDTRKRASAASQKARRAHILLLADVDGPDALIDAEDVVYRIDSLRCCSIELDYTVAIR